MTKTKQHTRDFHLVRNNNGEWISDDNAVFISRLEAGILQVQAAKNGKELSLQHGPDNSIWCYKHEYEEVTALDVHIPQVTSRKLRIVNK